MVKFDPDTGHLAPFIQNGGHMRVELRPREHEVLRGIMRGQTSKQMAVELGISIKTVETHRSNAFVKLKARSSGQAVAHYLNGKSG